MINFIKKFKNNIKLLNEVKKINEETRTFTMERIKNENYCKTFSATQVFKPGTIEKFYDTMHSIYGTTGVKAIN